MKIEAVKINQNAEVLSQLEELIRISELFWFEGHEVNQETIRWMVVQARILAVCENAMENSINIGGNRINSTSAELYDLKQILFEIWWRKADLRAAAKQLEKFLLLPPADGEKTALWSSLSEDPLLPELQEWLRK